jgi:two-component system alkaline phosphatase synthesis response regulator PhoP
MNPSRTVLVVDDEPDIVEILSYNLTKENYRVMKAYSGDECLEQARLNRPDLIILDIRMPGTSGIEACREIKQDLALKDIPVLFLTADSDEYTTMNAADAGGEHYITKPIRPSFILSVVKEILK